MHALKTGALIRAAVLLGGLCGTALTTGARRTGSLCKACRPAVPGG